jgi:hypothetical protein
MTAALLLLAAQTIAAPIPEPFAVLDSVPPPKGRSAEEHRRRVVTILTSPRTVPRTFTKEDGKGGMIGGVRFEEVGPEVLSDPAVRQLKTVANMSAQEARTWLRNNLKVVSDGEGGRIRMKFSAGARAERVVVLNGLLRAYFRLRDEELSQTRAKIRVSKARAVLFREQLRGASPAARAQIETSLKKEGAETRNWEDAVERLQKAGVRKWAK